MAGAFAYTRVLEPSRAVCKGLPQLAGADGARLVLKSDGVPIGPPAGAWRFAARWYRGRISGEADILVMPLAAWGSEVHVSVRSPRALPGALIWRGRRLSRLAAHLAMAVRESAARTNSDRRSAPREAAVRSGWLFAPPSEAAR
jgi:hypothetical protein